jgi:hypothetical protein
MRPAALAAAFLLLILPALSAGGQRPVQHNSAPQARQFPASPPRQQTRQQPRQQGRQQGQGSGPYQGGQYQNRRYQAVRPYPGQFQRWVPAGRSQSGVVQGPGQNYPAANVRPAFPGSQPDGYARPGFSAGRPANTYPGTVPPGHLGDWLNRHSDLPPQEQERLLRNDPNFNRLPPATQQRLSQQLHQLNQMPAEQRQRRLERGEAIEHMAPQDRQRLSAASGQFASLPPDRRTLVKHAFQDLRSVPPDQRQIVLNSARYQGTFSQQERDILSNFLRVEPYEPPH